MDFGIIMALRKEQSGVKEFEQSCPLHMHSRSSLVPMGKQGRCIVERRGATRASLFQIESRRGPHLVSCPESALSI